MKAILRKTALAAGLAATFLLPTSANAAPAALVFTGSADIACFGCGVPSACHADLSVAGATHSGNAVTTQCTATELPGDLCLVSGSAFGVVTGTSGTAAGLSLGFNWTRVGTVAVITISGDSTGAGVAAFAPSGAACGAAVTDAQIVGSVAGV